MTSENEVQLTNLGFRPANSHQLSWNFRCNNEHEFSLVLAQGAWIKKLPNEVVQHAAECPTCGQLVFHIVSQGH